MKYGKIAEIIFLKEYMFKSMIKIGLFFLLCSVVILLILYFNQDRMVYFPDKKIEQTPKDIGLAYEEIYLKTKDGTDITGWYIPAINEKGTLLFCHGNAGNISHRLDSIKIFNDLNLNVLIFDYRGYGKSSGRPSEKGTYLDAESAWDYLISVKKKSPRGIIVFGRSLGAAVAAEIALRKNPAGLIIESGFTSIQDIGAKLYPWLPVRLVSRFQYATIKKIGFIKCPKLIIHSPEDELIPFEQGKAIFEKASQPKEFLEIKGGHNEGFLISGRKYTDGIKRFIEKYLQG
jgi:fermentation-respiration switch protein FrsA (DUF1100 family)